MAPRVGCRPPSRPPRHPGTSSRTTAFSPSRRSMSRWACTTTRGRGHLEQSPPSTRRRKVRGPEHSWPQVSMTLKTILKLLCVFVCVFLGAEPGRAPTRVRAKSLSASEVEVSWKALPWSTSKKRVLGYEVRDGDTRGFGIIQY